MVKKSLLWLYRIAIWLAGLALLLVIATALVLHFWAMPNISQYKDDIAAYATQATKHQVVIGNIQADWQGVNPHLQLSNVTLYDAQNRPALQLKNTEIALSWLSIPMLEPHLAELVIQAPELTIRRVASGEIFVAGISMQGESKPELPNWLLRQSRLAVLDAKVTWMDEKRNAPALSLQNLNLEVFSPPWRSLIKNHSVILSASPSVGTKAPIKLSGSFYGNDVRHTEKWHGNVTLDLQQADLAAFTPWVDYPIQLSAGTGSTELSIQFAQQQVESLTSNVTIENLQLQLKPKLPPVTFTKLSGSLNWKNLSQFKLLGDTQKAFGQSLSVAHLNASSTSGLNLQDVNAEYTQTNDGKQTLQAQLASLNLASLQAYIAQLSLPEAMLSAITAAAPQGTLEKLDLYWEAQQAKTVAYRVESQFKNLSIQAQNQWPGFSNLSGKVSATQTGGELKLNATQALLDIKDVLRWPIPADTLIGDIRWNIKNQVKQIDVSNLKISNAHLAGTVNARYTMDGIKGGMLDLDGQFGNGNAKYAPFYYPMMLGKTTLHWLDTSILAGKAENIRLTVKGRLADFPFVDSKNRLDPKLGLFRVTASVDDALLEYGTGWPVVDKLDIDLLFEGKRMELNSRAGQVFGNKILKSKTTIAQLDADYPMLIIDADVVGPVSEGVKFVNKSPVLEVTEGFTEDLKTTGTGKLTLGLKIPMEDLEAAQYKGLYQITNGSMDSESIPALTNLNGALEFTESSLSAKNMKGLVFGSPVAFNLNTAKDKSIHIAAKGRLSDDSIRQVLKEENFSKAALFVGGSADWVGDITIQKPRVEIAIRSDLVGIHSRLPAPLDKAASQSMSLRVDKKQDANSDTLYVNLGNKLGFKLSQTLSHGKSQIEALNINLNSSPSGTLALDSPKAKGVSITGQLAYLDADAWRYAYQNLAENNQQASALPIQRVALKIDALDIFNRRINDLKINDFSYQDTLQANIQSREITGSLQWAPKNNGKLTARLSNLTVPEAAPDKVSAVKEEAANDTQQFVKLTQDYPALDITADNFEINKKNLGSLVLVAYPQNDDWEIEKLKFTTPDSVLSAEGVWNNWVRSPNTYLNINWEIKDLGKTIKKLGYPDTIKDGAGTLTGRLHWPGSPQQFDVTRLNGELEFDMRKGQILQVQPGVGRLLGLLSLQSLPRRLTLDFRDLFSSGFAFDKISANVQIERGVMRSDNFAMSGPAADVTIKGETNLQKETQHLYVKVLPRISDSLSLAALAGGPLAGAVAFLAQKILKDPLNKIASSEYEIIGTWDNPQEVKTTDVNNNNNAKPPLQ